MKPNDKKIPDLKERLLNQIEEKPVPELLPYQKAVLANAEAIDARTNKGWGPGGARRPKSNFAEQLRLRFEESNK